MKCPFKSGEMVLDKYNIGNVCNVYIVEYIKLFFGNSMYRLTSLDGNHTIYRIDWDC